MKSLKTMLDAKMPSVRPEHQRPFLLVYFSLLGLLISAFAEVVLWKMKDLDWSLTKTVFVSSVGCGLGLIGYLFVRVRVKGQ
jgi:hypothetical protein